MAYLAYKLIEKERQKLLEKFPPKFPIVKYDHITIQMCGEKAPLPEAPKSVQIRGIADDGQGIQVFLVNVNGTPVRPVDGLFWHITASYDSKKMAPACFDYQSPGKEQKETPYRAKMSNGFLLQILDEKGNPKPIQNPTWHIQIFDQPIEIQTIVKKEFTSDELKKISKEKLWRRDGDSNPR